MAHYTVKHSCGHAEDVQLFGKWSDRDEAIERMSSKPCRACVDKKYAQESVELGYPPLSGTEKQVAWANKIRITIADNIQRELNWRTTLASNRNENEGVKERVDAINKILANWIKTETSAKWWIDHRDQVCHEILKRY